MANILIVEDTELMRESMRETLARMGHDVSTAADGAQGCEMFDLDTYHLVITDLKLPKKNGIEVLEHVYARSEDAQIILVTAHATVENAVEAMKKGAYDYIQKPFGVDELEQVVTRALEHRALKNENEYLKTRLKDRDDHQLVSGGSAAMKQLLDQVEQLAPSDSTVLIQGESGSGKEVLARTIHYQSKRADRPFLAVNCAALSAGLLESELFGHEKGAFTGADKQRKGRFEIADGGTLLLDEVSEIDLGLQAKLLRVLQEKSFERVGSSTAIKTDVRVLATTNRNLQEAIKEGTFREDLFYRLNVFPVKLPPLRDRLDDLGALVEHFIVRFAQREGKNVTEIQDAALSVMKNYHWPGNVRELANIMERAVVLCRDGVIRENDIAAWLTGEAASGGEGLDAWVGRPIAELELAFIGLTLDRFGGNRDQTAEALGITTRTLRDKIKKIEAARSG
jgi:DNA-binding NtrC family response regulator